MEKKITQWQCSECSMQVPNDMIGFISRHQRWHKEQHKPKQKPSDPPSPEMVCKPSFRLS